MSERMKLILLFIAYWCIAFAFYFKTAGAGFVTDEIGWLQNYEATGWKGVFNAFNDRSLHFFYHTVGFSLWKLFRFNGFAWMTVFISLHAAIAILSFRIFERIFSNLEIASATFIAFMGSLLFAVSPYQTEPLVWYACIHYLVASFLLLLAFNIVLKYLQQPNSQLITGFYVCFFISLFTLEISFTFPIILLLLFLFAPSKVLYGRERGRLIKIFIAPSAALLAFYFLLSSVLRGSAVGHYGAAEHLNFNIPLLMGNLGKYISKLFFLSQFIAYEIREKAYIIYEKEKFGWCLFASLSVIGSLYLMFHKKLKPALQGMVLSFLFFVIALLPILNLYFSFIVNVEGDRFTYFASIFAYQFAALTCVVLFRKLGWILLAVFLFYNIKFLSFNIESWGNSKVVQQSLITSFKWYDAEKIYLLNIPDNFRGTYMFRSFSPDNSFAETLAIRGNEDIEGKVSEILEYNMFSISDSVIVERISDNELKVTLSNPGSWLWQNGIGASDYSTDEYEVKRDEWNHGYTLKIKNKKPNTVYLYQASGEWREVKDF